ncbi:alpha/beta fold hydrolase, partial [Vibrio zhanjiangensis]|uniref:alpha/beta fold hydrolase n=1 Tax=Vibrio zhanjiangensis TaxID=1046128 RepID=UPI0024E1275D
MTFRDTRYNQAEGYLSAVECGYSHQAKCSIVFIHGWLDNAASFMSVMQTLNHMDPALHLCAIDLPGHGQSSHKSGNNFYPFHDYIDDIYQLLSNFSSNRLVLVGHSLGALVASCYSAAFPEQISGLVEIEGRGPLSEDSNQAVSRLRDGVLSRQKIRSRSSRAFSSLDDAVEVRSEINLIASELIRPIVLRGLKRTSDGWYWRHDEKLQSQSLYRMSHEHAQSVRQSISCPHLVVLGEHGFPYLQHKQKGESDSVDVAMVEGVSLLRDLDGINTIRLCRILT